MPLPSGDIQWPPDAERPFLDYYREAAAWYSGDLEALSVLYAQRLYSPFYDATNGTNAIKEELRQCVHVPATSDIAQTSAAMLFGEHPKIRVAGADEIKPPQEIADAQVWLDAYIEDNSFHSLLSESADIDSGLGGVYLKVNWNKALSDDPLVSIAHVNTAVPEFQFGILTAVTFWREVTNDGTNTYRWLERHEPGWIYNGLYQGSYGQLGKQVDLKTLPQTSALAEAVETGIDGLLCVYIPNALPNRRFLGDRIGRADTAGAESMMQSLDQCFTSLIRDVMLGMGRIAAPASYFEKLDDGSFAFNVFRQAYMSLEGVMDGGPGTSVSDNINVSQFAIRTEEHIKAAEGYLRQIFSHAGYSPQSFGMDIQGAVESGKAQKIRQAKSFATTAKKADYWRAGLQRILWLVQCVKAKHLGGGVTPQPVNVEMQDGVPTDLDDIATSVEVLHRAEAVSIDWMVRKVNPDKDEEWIQAEVKRIEDEAGRNVPDFAPGGEPGEGEGEHDAE